VRWYREDPKAPGLPTEIRATFDIRKYKAKAKTTNVGADDFIVPTKPEIVSVPLEQIKLGFVANGIAGTFFLNDVKMMEVAAEPFKTPLTRQDEQTRRPAKWVQALQKGKNILRFEPSGAPAGDAGRFAMVRIYSDLEGVQQPFNIPKSYQVPRRVFVERRIDAAAVTASAGKPIEIPFILK